MFRFTEQSIKKIDEKIILINVIGLLHALENQVIVLEEAEKFLFSPYVCKELHRKGCDDKILKIIMKACELEDIYSLMPEKFCEIITEISKEASTLLAEYETYSQEQWLSY